MDCNGRCPTCGRSIGTGGCSICDVVVTICWCGQRVYPPSFAHNCPKAYTYGETKDTRLVKAP